MNSRTPPALCVCLLVLLAGCNGFFPGPDATTGPTPQADYPPGLVMNGVADPDALTGAHEDALANTSYELTVARTISRDGRLRGEENATVRFGRGDQRLTHSRTAGPFYAGRSSRTAIWSNDSVTAIRRVDENGTHFDHIEAGFSSASWGTRFYDVFRFDVNRTADGFTLTSTGVRDRNALGTTFTNTSNVSVTMQLDRQGVIQSYRLELDGNPLITNGTTRYHLTETVNLTRVGGLTVERPPWVATALNRSGGN